MDDALNAAVVAFETFVLRDDAGKRRVHSRREAWRQAKERVLAALSEFASAEKTSRTDRGLVPMPHPALGYKNFDAVQLAFGSVPTGVLRVDPEAEAAGIERGAALVFAQSESGLVAVDQHPFHTELPDDRTSPRPPPLRVAVLEPESLERDKVLRLVTQFLEWAPTTSIRSAEATSPAAPIGFVCPAPRQD